MTSYKTLDEMVNCSTPYDNDSSYDVVYVVMSILNGYKNIECVFDNKESALAYAEDGNFGNDLRDKQYYVLEEPLFD